MTILFSDIENGVPCSKLFMFNIDEDGRVTDLKKWAIENDIADVIVSYLTTAKLQDLSCKIIGLDEWKEINNCLDEKENIVDEDKISAILDSTVYNDFIPYVKCYFPSNFIDDILDGKITEFKTDIVSKQYAIMTSLLYKLSDIEKDIRSKHPEKKRLLFSKISEGKDFFGKVDNFLQFMMDNFQNEIVLLGVRSSINIYKLPIELDHMKNFKKIVEKYKDYILYT
jgi:hypothetical protein